MKRQPKLPRVALIRRPARIDLLETPEALAASEAEMRAGLLALIDGGKLRGSMLFQAGKVLTRIGLPPRLAVIGSSDAAKRDALAALLEAPSALITLAAPVQFVARDGDSTRHWRAAPDAAEICRIEAPILEAMSIFAAPAGTSRRALREDMNRAASHCELSLWACNRFDTAEAALWSEAPASLRGTAFLLAPRVGVAPPGFLAAFDPAEEIDALRGALIDRARLARQVRRDHAGLFLARFAAPAPPAKRAFAFSRRNSPGANAHPSTPAKGPNRTGS